MATENRRRRLENEDRSVRLRKSIQLVWHAQEAREK
jgi:hypothetical protein